MLEIVAELRPPSFPRLVSFVNLTQPTHPGRVSLRTCLGWVGPRDFFTEVTEGGSCWLGPGLHMSAGG